MATCTFRRPCVHCLRRRLPRSIDYLVDAQSMSRNCATHQYELARQTAAARLELANVVRIAAPHLDYH